MRNDDTENMKMPSLAKILILPKNPVSNFILGKSEEVRSKNPVHFRERDFWLPLLDSNQRPAD